MDRFERHTNEAATSYAHNQSSVFTALIESGVMSRLKAIHVVPINETELELKVLMQINDDFRWHWISQTMEDPNAVYFISDTLIHLHELKHPEDHQEMQKWKAELSNPKLYFVYGASVYFGAV